VNNSRSWIGGNFALSIDTISAAKGRLDGQRTQTPKGRRATRGAINHLNDPNMEAVNWGDFHFDHGEISNEKSLPSRRPGHTLQ
jgi:hypothetical protein